MQYTWIIVLVILGAVFLLKKVGQVSAEDARRMLKEGAVVIDVRTDQEFSAGHLPGAINVPLSDLSGRITSVVPDPSTPVLLHCHSGSRSAMARAILRKAGYENAHNLGSYGRAAMVTGG